MTQVQKKCSTWKCWQDLKEIGIALFYVIYKKLKVYSHLPRTNLIFSSKKIQLMLILTYFKQTLFPVVIITHHSMTQGRHTADSSILQNFNSERLFKADLWMWNLMILGWYTCEFGPSKHHAAAIQITSSVQELYFVPAETNGKTQSHLGWLDSPKSGR